MEISPCDTVLNHTVLTETIGEGSIDEETLAIGLPVAGIQVGK